MAALELVPHKLLPDIKGAGEREAGTDDPALLLRKVVKLLLHSLNHDPVWRRQSHRDGKVLRALGEAAPDRRQVYDLGN